MTRSVAGLIQARLSSERCPGKMLRSFAGSTLVDVALEKLAGRASFPLYFAAHEEALIDVCDEHDWRLRIIHRDAASAASNDVRVIMNYLDEILEDHVMFINACHPFLTLATLERAVACFLETEAVSMTSVRLSNTWYYQTDGSPINLPDPRRLDTKTTQPLIQVAHAFHIFPRKRFMEHGFFWTHIVTDPSFYAIPEVEAMDIDTELDFEVAEALYLRRLEARDE